VGEEDGLKELSFPEHPRRVVRLDRAGRSGDVRVYYGVTRHPSEAGFPALPGWAKARRAGVGFPMVKCEVESSKPGYWSNLGWIQWVTQDFPDGRAGPRLVDRLPAFLELDTPFTTMGYSPSFFDAPAQNSLPRIDFRATLFLCTLPMLHRTEPIVPLAGFVWGHHIDADGGTPTPYSLESARGPDWTRVRAAVASRHRTWNFARVFYTPAAGS
jgi:hypothetical protein